MKRAIVSAIFVTAVLLLVGCERSITGDTPEEQPHPSLSCLQCHTDGSGPNQAIVAQFEHSIHGSGDNTNRNRLTSSGYQSCERCHTSEGFIAFVTGVPASGDHFTAFDCFTCHEPHTNGNFQVRVTDPVTLEDGAVYDRGNSNTCATCHHSRYSVHVLVVDSANVNSRYGPHHSNQGDMLIGTNAYEYAGYTYNNSWHATGVTNGCPQCHMSAANHETIGGHSWNMVNEERGFQNITGCNVDGCHKSNPLTSLNRETANDFDGDGVTEGVQTEIEDLLDSLGNLLEDAGLVNSSHSPITNVVAEAEMAGALYNFIFVEEDRSEGVHNTRYTVALLKSSINYLNTGNPNGAPQDPNDSGSRGASLASAKMMPAH